MHGSLISSTNDCIQEDPSDSILLDIIDADAEFFPSQPLPGMMKLFKPLLDAMKKSIGNRPIAIAEDVEKILRNDHPNAISDQNLNDFTAYVLCARQGGLPIRCDQVWEKPKYMWFHLVEEINEVPVLADETINHIGMKDRGSIEQFNVEEETLESNMLTDDANGKSTVSHGTKFGLFETEWTQQTHWEANPLDLFVQNPEIDSSNYTSNLFSDLREVLKPMKLEDEQALELPASSFAKSKRKRKNRKRRDIQDQVEKIINKMECLEYKFCSDQNLFTFTEAIVKYIVMSPDSGSIIGAAWMEKFIQHYYPSLLGSPSDTNSTKEKVYRDLLRRSNEPKWNMPIFYLRDGFRIDIGKLQKIVTLVKEDK